MNSHAKDILDSANRYGVVDLKLKAEACLVKTTAFWVENLLDILLYADFKNCALLTEAAVDFMIQNIEQILFKDAPRKWVNDVKVAFCRDDKQGGLHAMYMNKLCWKAHMKGLNVDSSWEMLIATLSKL
jgi:hypothetical protein